MAEVNLQLIFQNRYGLVLGQLVFEKYNKIKGKGGIKK